MLCPIHTATRAKSRSTTIAGEARGWWTNGTESQEETKNTVGTQTTTQQTTDLKHKS